MERTGHRMTVDTCKHVLACISPFWKLSPLYMSHVSGAQCKVFCCVLWHKDIYHSCACRIEVTCLCYCVKENIVAAFLRTWIWSPPCEQHCRKELITWGWALVRIYGVESIIAWVAAFCSAWKLCWRCVTWVWLGSEITRGLGVESRMMWICWFSLRTSI